MAVFCEPHGGTISYTIACIHIYILADSGIQIYHQTGALLPVPVEDYTFLQIYFMDNLAREVDQRCAHNNSVKRSIVMNNFKHFSFNTMN